MSTRTDYLHLLCAFLTTGIPLATAAAAADAALLLLDDKFPPQA